MLRALRIKNFAIIDDLSLSFDPGFTVLSGETGAGKSIIIDALGMLLGEKASPDLIKTGRKEAVVEAFFDPADIALLKELAVDSAEGIVARRIFTSQGRSRAFINDAAVSLPTLSSICRELITIYGQHEHHGLLRKETHLSFIDSLGNLGGEAAALHELYGRIGEKQRRLREARTRAREREQMRDLLMFQIEEIDRAGLRPGEDEDLDKERAILANLARLREDAESAYSLLYGAEDSCIERVSRIAALARDIARVDQAGADVSAALDSVVTQLKDIALTIRRLKDGYEGNPGRLSELDERRETIRRLERKYGQGVEAIHAYRTEAEEKVRAIERTEDDLKDLEASLARDQEVITAMAERLSDQRRTVVGEVHARVGAVLEDLGFSKAIFEVNIERQPEVTESGVDVVEFLFSANPGEAPRPLAKIASGGELSRVMLALKTLELALGGGDAHAERTLIFDEVDAGIGGATAFHVGNKLKGIADRYQALCITHLPQIAALADHHLRVQKVLHTDHVEVRVDRLEGTAREEEIARMLSGKITPHSLRHARELLTANRGAAGASDADRLFT